MAARVQNKRDTTANWTSNNPVLLAGELGYESDTSKFKIGDGSTGWSSLNYFRPCNQDNNTTSSPTFTALSITSPLNISTRGAMLQESAGSVDFCNNLYNDGSWKYKTSDYGILFQTGAGGDFSIFTAPSGTAGNAASLTQRLYLTNAGALTVGGAIRSNSGFNMNGTAGAGGSFTTANGKTVTVSGGIITSIV